MKFLAIYEAPCVGTVPKAFEAKDVFEADEICWNRSFDNRYYVEGSYDLYKIVYNHETHKHELVDVWPEIEAMEKALREEG